MKAEQLLKENHLHMVNTLAEVIKFDTTKADDVVPQPNAPFGQNIADCLDYVLKIGEELGFDTYNCDGYAGHIDFVGSGDGIVGVLGHLDVVPANASDGWKEPPFSANIVDGKMYGRGTMDDKGPMIACLYALFALKDSGFVPTKTIRLIFGCDEESGMDCVKYYFTKMPKPDISFSPDGDFPVINREKGIYQFDINFGKIDANIVDITAGERANVVAGKCVATVNSQLVATNGQLLAQNGVELSQNGELVILTTHGKNAHGSQPQEGKNATWAMFSVLSKLCKDDNALQFIAEKMCDYTGKSWGIALSDNESGNLTCNIGVVRVVNGELILSIDIRFPVTYSCCDITNLLQNATPYTMTIDQAKEPLFVAEDSFLVTTLMDVYNSTTNSNLQPIAIGGGTYSRSLSNCVAFGPLFPNEEQTIHMPNEVIIIDNLYKQAELYLKAMYELSK